MHHPRPNSAVDAGERDALFGASDCHPVLALADEGGDLAGGGQGELLADRAEAVGVFDRGAAEDLFSSAEDGRDECLAVGGFAEGFEPLQKLFELGGAIDQLSDGLRRAVFGKSFEGLLPERLGGAVGLDGFVGQNLRAEVHALEVALHHGEAGGFGDHADEQREGLAQWAVGLFGVVLGEVPDLRDVAELEVAVADGDFGGEGLDAAVAVAATEAFEDGGLCALQRGFEVSGVGCLFGTGGCGGRG